MTDNIGIAIKETLCSQPIVSRNAFSPMGKQKLKYLSVYILSTVAVLNQIQTQHLYSFNTNCFYGSLGSFNLFNFYRVHCPTLWIDMQCVVKQKSND